MSFWTSQQLALNLPHLINQFSLDQIDCNSYTLRIGDEVYISPTDESKDPKSTTIRKLSAEEAFTIPPGQFAYLITQETIQVPSNAMAFISIKASLKFKGLMNVSGFHVDPGYQGRLVFSVFNAGPTVVHLKQGQNCFLIWYASLNEDSERRKIGSYNSTLSPDTINSISGEIQSLEGLSNKIQNLEKKLDGRINKLEPKYAELATKLSNWIAIGLVILGAVLTIFVTQFLSAISTRYLS